VESFSHQEESEFANHWNNKRSSRQHRTKMAAELQAADAVAGPANEVEKALRWIGFTPVQATAIGEEIGDTLSAFTDMASKDITTMAAGFAGRDGQDKIIFRMNRTRLIKDMIPWAKDWERRGEEPNLNGLGHQGFIAELALARKRENARTTAADTRDTRAKEATPGKLTGPKNWESWFDKTTNYLSIMTGTLDIPLIYVIRDYVDIGGPQDDEDEEIDDFTKTCIRQAPHEGAYFEEDARRVHELIWGFCIGEESESFLKPLRKYENGKRDMGALIAHYKGPGNLTRRLTEAARMSTTLHYKTEGAMPFDTFISKCKKMFNMYEEAGEPFHESAKLRFLLEKCEDATHFHSMISAIRSSMTLDENSYDFDKAASALTAQIKPRETRARGVGATGTEDRGSDKASASIMKDGKIFTGRYNNWKKLSKADKDRVTAERKRLGIKSPLAGKGKKFANQRKQISELQRKIAALEGVARLPTDGGDEEPESDGDGKAGNSFGGRGSMARKKQKTKE